MKLKWYIASQSWFEERESVLLINLYFSVVGEVLAFSGRGLGFTKSVVNHSQYLTIESEWDAECFMRTWPLEGPHTKQCLNLVSAFAAQIERNSQLTQR